MAALQLLLYNTTIRLYYLMILIASLFNEKAKQWIKGRSGLKIPEMEGRVIWVHCASVGEFEQGRPLIEEIKKMDPQAKILLTFFSPSGYELRKDFALADEVSYLPLDTPASAREFLDHTNPRLAIFIKYEFWYHYLRILQKREVPTYLVSATFRRRQAFFQWYGTLYRRMLRSFSHLFVQDRRSEALLAKVGVDNVTVTGDTRFDRVAEIAKEAAEFPLIAAFRGDSRVLVAGSTWEPDEEILANYINKKEGLKYIIAPHEIKEARLQSLEKRINRKTGRYSQLDESSAKEVEVLIIDNIGMLAALYRYGDFAYIGGGFGTGIHNVLEAAVYGIPVLFGPKHQKFLEAVTLIERKGAFSIENERALFNRLTSIKEDLVLYRRMANACKEYVQENIGASQRVLQQIEL
jgi:3-deoxy-D-manno-octulosonic-acid transferase